MTWAVLIHKFVISDGRNFCSKTVLTVEQIHGADLFIASLSLSLSLISIESFINLCSGICSHDCFEPSINPFLGGIEHIVSSCAFSLLPIHLHHLSSVGQTLYIS